MGTRRARRSRPDVGGRRRGWGASLPDMRRPPPERLTPRVQPGCSARRSTARAKVQSRFTVASDSPSVSAISSSDSPAK